MTTKKQFAPKADDISDFIKRAGKYQSYVAKLEQSRFVTGFKIIDDDIRGIGPGELMMVAAYSGTFKSAYLQNMLMRYSASTKLHSMFFSLEMPDEKVFEREMQIASGVMGTEVEYHLKNTSARTRTMMEQCRNAGSGLVLTVERPKLTLDHVSSYLDIAREKGHEIGVVGIDYMGLMKHQTSKTSADAMEELSNGAKELSKEQGVPVIMLTQINRAAAKAQSEEGAEIHMHDLKYGGEAGADIVLGLYRDSEETVVLKVLKNRGGRIGQRYQADITTHALRFNDFYEYVPIKKKRKTSELPGGYDYGSSDPPL